MDNQKNKTIKEAINLFDNTGLGIGTIFPQIYDRAQLEILNKICNEFEKK